MCFVVLFVCETKKKITRIFESVLKHKDEIMNITFNAGTTPIHFSTSFENVTLGQLFDDLNLTHFQNMSLDNLTNHLHQHLQKVSENVTYASGAGGPGPKRDPLPVVIPVTICYAIIFIAGVLGNVITCTVISRNKSMHTATNYYLFNLAISDLLLLVSGEFILWYFKFNFQYFKCQILFTNYFIIKF